jgi:nucleoid DNA-binding protein
MYLLLFKRRLTRLRLPLLKVNMFEVRLTRPRVGRNPNRPEVDVTIPARATVKFKAGKIMRQRVLLRTEELKNSSAK